MPTIQISKMPSAELIRLISAASAELARRSDVELPPPPKDLPAAVQVAQKPTQVLRPGDDDADFVLYVKSRLESGDYISAADRRRVAAIAIEFGAWVRRQGLPTVHNAGDWQKCRGYLSTKRAAER